MELAFHAVFQKSKGKRFKDHQDEKLFWRWNNYSDWWSCDLELVLESSIDNVLIANLTQLAGQTTEFNAKSRDVAGGGSDNRDKK